MNENIEKSVCFTGHRKLIHADLYERLSEIITVLAEDGYENFICGGAVGFDMLSAKCVLDLKKTFNNIKLIIAVPCKNQDRYMSDREKEAYKKMIDEADETIILSDSYYRGCMHKRNRYMVDRSSICVCYVCKEEGGSLYTVKYAEKCKRTIINVI